MPRTAPLAPAVLRDRLLVVYYLATPLFALADFAAGVNVRLAALGSVPGLRAAIYALCTLAGVASWRAPRLAAPFAVLEGGANVLLLVLGVMLPIAALPTAVDSGGTAAIAVEIRHAVANLLIAGPLWVAALYRNPLFAR